MDLRERHQGAQRHPWELARARFVRAALDAAGILEQAGRVLDVGSGDAWLAAQLAARVRPGAAVVCWDANYSDNDRDVLRAEHPAVTFVAAKPEGPFDLLLLLDVLEHIEDDRGFLSDAVTNLASPGAHVLVTVPAWQSLFSQRDTHLAHYRRYSTAGARALLAASGLRPIADGGLFHSLLPMRAASVLVERVRGPRRDAGVNPVEWNGGQSVTRAMAAVLAAEARVSLGLGRLGVALPGLSYWALCRKP